MGKKNKSLLRDLIDDLQNWDILKNDDLSSMYGGTSNHVKNDNRGDNGVSDDCPQ